MAFFSLDKFKNKRVCVALSGGIDSVCLLHYFLTGASDFGIALSAVTCEHGIRGEKSLTDLAFVKDLCSAWGVPLTVFQRDIPAFAAERKMGLEEAGRAFRRECFLKILDEGKADILTTAHHRDDYAETVLFRLARGTSLAGMKVFTDKFARPLSGVCRTEIEAYAQKHDLPYTEDESNADTAYTRNAIRYEILPLLEKYIAGARGNLVSFARLAAEDDDYLQSLAQAALENAGENCVPVSLPDPVFYRAAVIALKGIGVVRDYTGDLLREISSLRTLQSGKRICLPSGAVAVREYDKIVFYYPAENGAEIPFATGEYPFGKDTIVVSETKREGLRCDFDKIPQECVIRTRREGDFFTPYAGKRKTLKKFLTDKKIPSRVGGTLPLLADGSEILAVFGVEISDKIKITEKTTRCVYLARREN